MRKNLKYNSAYNGRIQSANLFVFILFTIIATSTMFNSCLKPDKRLIIKNNTRIAVYYEIIEDSCFDKIFADGRKMKKNDLPCFSLYNKLTDRGFSHEIVYGSWPGYMKRLPDHSIWIYFFSINDVRYYPCDTIRKYRKFIKRKKVSLEELEKSNWTITYP